MTVYALIVHQCNSVNQSWVNIAFLFVVACMYACMHACMHACYIANPAAVMLYSMLHTYCMDAHVSNLSFFIATMYHSAVILSLILKPDGVAPPIVNYV